MRLQMDLFVKTIITQSGLIVLGFFAAGIAVGLLHGASRYAKLQHAMTLNMIPSPLH